MKSNRDYFSTTNFKPVILCIVLVTLIYGCKSDTNGESVGNIDVTHQKITLQFDWKTKQAIGTSDIALRINKKSDSIYLDAGMLSIDKIKLKNNNKELTYHYNGKDTDDGLLIVLDKIYESDKELNLSINYRTNWVNQSDPNNIWGSFGNGIRFFEHSFTEKERRKQAWAFGESKSSKYWFPCNDDPHDLRTTELVITVEKPLLAISNGVLKDVKDNSDNTRTFRWEATYPHASHLTSFTVGEYENYKQSFEDITINNYGYPDESIGTKESVISLPDMMKYYSEYTGKKYPYPEYSQIFVQDFGGWKGNMMSSSITENMVDDKTTHEDFLYLWDVVEGEALAFQWFGNYTKPSSWNDVWLTKAFSRHLSGLYNQYVNGNEEYQVYQHRPDMMAYLGDWNSKVPTIVVPKKIDDLDAFVNGNAPYAKGALVLNMLRKEIGDEKWKQLIRSYISDFGNKMVSTNNFIDKVNKINDASLDWFFNLWVFGVGHPKFKITKTYDENTKKLLLTVEQTQKVDSLVSGKKIPYFEGKISIEIDNEKKDISLLSIKTNVFTFSLEEEPKLVNFDYEDTWIKETEFNKTTEELLAELSMTSDILHRVSTMLKLTQIATDSGTPENHKSEIISSLFDIANSEMYWRNRLFTIWQLHNIFTTNSEDGIVRLNKEQENLLMAIIDDSKSWVKANVINFLGDTRNKKHTSIYLDGLKDYSDRVTFMSAIALGKTEDSRAFDALMNLPSKPSWKNQSLISAMYGFKELKDARSYDFVLSTLTDSDNPHWNLGTPIWDHRLAAAYTLVALDKVDEGYDLIHKRLKDALYQGHINDIFFSAQQISILGDPRGKVVFEELKEKFGEDKNAMKAIQNLENRFNK